MLNLMLASRYFNSIIILNDSTIRKASKDSKKMIAEYRWFQERDEYNHPNVFNLQVGDISSYDMEYIHGRTLSDIYVNELIPVEEFCAIIDFIFNKIITMKNQSVKYEDYKFRESLNHLYIENKEGIARVSAKVLEGQSLTLAIEPGHMEGALLPEKIQLVEYPPENQVDILISADKEMGRGSLLLRPREYVLGMGCRKEKEPEKIEAFIAETLKKRKIQLWQISALASIWQKKEEPGFLQWSEKHRIPFLTFSGEELMEVTGNLASSAFVKEKVGADNVCERAALKACGQNGCLAAGKEARDGMTIAIAKRDWRVAFDEE